MSARKPQRNLFWAALIGLPVLAAIGAMALMTPPAPKQATQIADASAVTLVTDDGRSIRWSDLNGQPRAVFFGFTNCPDICPITLGALDAALTKLGPEAAGLKVYFVTVDPKRDTPAALHAYLSPFRGRVVGLTGDAGALAQLTGAYHVPFQKIDQSGDAYTMSHGAAVLLLDAQGRTADSFNYNASPADMAQHLSALLAGAAPQSRGM